MVDVVGDAARYALDRHAAAIAERLGRAPRLADLVDDPHCFAAAPLPDVDGDGASETAVTEGCSWGTSGALHVLVFSSHGCPKIVGDLVAGELTPLPTTNAGVRDLEATCSSGCAGRNFSWTRYRWSGAAYEVAEEAACTLCTAEDLDHAAGRCLQLASRVAPLP